MIIYQFKNGASELLREVRNYYLEKEGKEIKLDDLEYLSLEFLIGLIGKHKSESETVKGILNLYKLNPLALELCWSYEVEILQMKKAFGN